jgi:hypothetical protein
MFRVSAAITSHPRSVTYSPTQLIKFLKLSVWKHIRKPSLNYYHFLQYRKQIEYCYPRVMDSPNFPQHSHVDFMLVARLLLSPFAQKLCRWEQRVFTTSHQLLLMLLKHLTMFIPTRNNRTLAGENVGVHITTRNVSRVEQLSHMKIPATLKKRCSLGSF